MIVAAAYVVEQLGRSVNHRNDNINPTVVIEVPKRGAVVHCSTLEILPGIGGNICKSSVSQVAKNAVRQLGIPADIAAKLGEVGIRREQVFPAVVVKIVNSSAPSGELSCRVRQPRTHGLVGEKSPFTEIAEQ